MNDIFPEVRLSEVDPSLARIEFGNGGYAAQVAARLLLASDSSTGHQYIRKPIGRAEHVVWSITREPGEHIEPYLEQIQSDAEQAAADAQTQNNS